MGQGKIEELKKQTIKEVKEFFDETLKDKKSQFVDIAQKHFKEELESCQSLKEKLMQCDNYLSCRVDANNYKLESSKLIRKASIKILV